MKKFYTKPKMSIVEMSSVSFMATSDETNRLSKNATVLDIETTGQDGVMETGDADGAAAKIQTIDLWAEDD